MEPWEENAELRDRITRLEEASKRAEGTREDLAQSLRDHILETRRQHADFWKIHNQHAQVLAVMAKIPETVQSHENEINQARGALRIVTWLLSFMGLGGFASMVWFFLKAFSHGGGS